MRWLWSFLGVSVLVIAAAAIGLWAATGFDTWNLSLEGVIALVVGSLLTAALTVGLMALVFYSNRSGHDEAAATREEDVGPV